ncbi:MAG TPA: FG-GAP-like repeat-containing protein [Pyrinomonadaceae bacterium]|jgi:uncharacterized delta-60 repeat protein
MEISSSRFMLLMVLAVTLLIAFLFFPTKTSAIGILDRTFGANGRVTTYFGEYSAANAAVVQPDGKIVVVGMARLNSSDPADVAIARYNQDGSLDASFGNGGKVTTNIFGNGDVADGVALQSDGKILVAGYTQIAAADLYDFLLIRYNSNGTLDETFDEDGIVTVNQSGRDFFHSVAIQADGKIIAVGEHAENGGTAAVLRFNTKGALDNTFGDGGLVYFQPQTYNSANLREVSILSNGLILVGGNGTIMGHGSGLLALLDRTGALVPDFGIGGTVTYVPFIQDFVVQPDGKIITTGIAINRYLPNGTPDSSFRTSNIGGRNIALLPNGRFVSGDFTSAVSLYSPAGTTIGRGFSNFSGSFNYAAQPDNKILVIGTREAQFAVMRFNAFSSQATRIASFDGDETTDPTVYRSNWEGFFFHTLLSTGGYQTRAGYRFLLQPRFVPEDYRGGGISEYTSWVGDVRTPGTFVYPHPANGSRVSFQWGITDVDVPVGGDYDGDGKTDYAVFRAYDDRYWYILQSSNNRLLAVQWGALGDKPVPADYDYDGITDIAVYRASEGIWYVRRSSDAGMTALRFGLSDDIPLTGDFDGDGRADFVVYRPSNGTWYLLNTTEGFRAVQFGISTDQPVPGDYDGDGRHDVAVFRQGIWYILGSTRGFYGVQWGVPGDIPVAVRYAY